MSCPCDQQEFPPRLAIPAGLSTLPRQIATFPEFRAAMLSLIPSRPALLAWRARSGGDFGVMLLEMFAYVCDSISFYDEVIADEYFLRTAKLSPSLRKLIALLGYVPRPAVAATADLAVFVEGRQPMVLPPGVAFRSGAFPGGPPQVFELTAPAKVHPFSNQWMIVENRPPTIDGGKHFPTLHLTYLRLDPKTNTLKKGQVFLFEVMGNPALTQGRTVSSISDFTGKDGATYKKITWDGPIAVPGSTPVASIRISKPTRVARLTTKEDLAGDKPIQDHGGKTFVHFDSLYADLQAGTRMILEKDDDVRYFQAALHFTVDIQIAPGVTTQILDKAGNPAGSVTSPPVTREVTDLVLDKQINDRSRMLPTSSAWTGDDAGAIKVHYQFVEAATVVAPAWSTLIQGDPLLLTPPYDVPQDGKSPSRFLMEDKDNTGLEVTGGINYASGALNLDATTPIPAALKVPVQLYGNVVTASRGETVPFEVLGSGDASIPSQTLKLKKKPLTYLPSPTAGNDAAVAASLKVYVDGILWSEVTNFYGVAPDAQVYIVRQNDDGDFLVTFGDGVRGGRLSTGNNNVVAIYRFGAGKLSPPAGSIKQLGKPVAELKSVRNPVAAAGGDDGEPAASMRTFAPRSALLLGRAVSILDMEAAAASAPGVRAVQAQWRWNKQRQSPVVQIYYIGEPGIQAKVAQKLRALTDPAAAIDVERAKPLPSTLSIAIEIDPRRLEGDVLQQVRAALMDPVAGLLAPEQIGIGTPLFRSRIFEAVLEIPGATAVTGLLWNGKPFDPYGISPGAGDYFDLEKGALLLNGKAGDSGQ